MQEKELLMIPGPTPVPQAVLRAGAKPMINHRGPEFARIQQAVNQGLKRTFQTGNEVITLTASGTGGMEAALVNVLSPGDRVLAVSIGAFGDRFAAIARTYGAEVDKLDFEWGKAADPDVIADRVKRGNYRAVLVTHNETSTGVTNDLAAISRAVRAGGEGPLLIADAVSSLVAIDLQTDAWQVDLVVAASQKAFMVPPGLAFVSVSSRAWEASKSAKMPRFYWDFASALKYMERGQTPFTPALPQIFGMEESLRLLEQEGLRNCFERHRRFGAAVRSAAQAFGLNLFADPAHASNVVTAITAPAGLAPKEIRKHLLDKYGVVLAGGQAHLSETVFRIGHLGFVSDTDILATLAAVGMGLNELGFSCDPAAGVRAAQQAFGQPVPA